MMEPRVFRVNDQKNLESSSIDAFLASHQDDGSIFWIDVVQPDVSALERLFAPLRLHPLVVEGCLDPTANPSVMPLPQCLYVKLPVQADWEHKERTALSCVCLSQALVTVHAAPASCLSAMGADFVRARHFHAVSVPAILYQVVDLLFDADLALALALRQHIDTLSDGIDDDAEAVPIGDILHRKRLIAYLTLTLEDQHRCATTLQTIESDFFSLTGIHEYFHDAMTHLEYALRLVARQETRMNELHQHYLLLLQEKTNHRLKLLTILTAVFMPLTLISSIYGMNFHVMPELGWSYGYPLILGVMVAIAATMIWFFYVKGWFN